MPNGNRYSFARMDQENRANVVAGDEKKENETVSQSPPQTPVQVQAQPSPTTTTTPIVRQKGP